MKFYDNNANYDDNANYDSKMINDIYEIERREI